jgi:Paf1
MNEDEDERHKREEKERRAQRKVSCDAMFNWTAATASSLRLVSDCDVVNSETNDPWTLCVFTFNIFKYQASKSSKSEAQLEKDRKRKEYRQNILKKHGAPGGDASSSSAKRAKTTAGAAAAAEAAVSSSAFQKLFEQRAQGFQIDFRFRNAPPRPPVGPCLLGQQLDAVIQGESKQYKALNSVEVNHKWKLHNETDLGVPLAPSAMDVKSYEPPAKEQLVGNNSRLHQDDAALLDWRGSMGDSAAEELKLRRDRARAAARAALSGKKTTTAQVKFSPSKQATTTTTTTTASGGAAARAKKKFSRVLNEDMQHWMRSTTYLSNDYSRKVHDFKSLAQTKQELAQDLQVKQHAISQRRSAQALAESFAQVATNLQHPTNKQRKPKRVYEVLPNVECWGNSFTHVIIDKAPKLADNYTVTDLAQSLIANVEKPEATARMSCDVCVPSKADGEHDDGRYESVQSYDLDVLPLKEEGSPHIHFCLWLDHDQQMATYLPVPARVQLYTGRPALPAVSRVVTRRPVTEAEKTEQEERMAELDEDLAGKHNITRVPRKPTMNAPSATSTSALRAARKSNDDGEDEYGDDDDDDDDDSDDGMF